MTGQVGNLYCYVKDRIKLGTFAFVRLFVKLGLDKACPQLPGTLPPGQGSASSKPSVCLCASSRRRHGLTPVR